MRSKELLAAARVLQVWGVCNSDHSSATWFERRLVKSIVPLQVPVGNVIVVDDSALQVSCQVMHHTCMLQGAALYQQQSHANVLRLKREMVH